MDLSVQIRGNGLNGDIKGQVDATHDAIRASLRPSEVGAGGSYSVALNSGVIAAGMTAGSSIFAFRWTDTTFACFVRRVRILAATDATAFAQGSAIFDLIRATGFSAQDTGGATLTLSAKSNALATRFSPSRQQIAASATGNIAIANTGALAAGTRTLDNNPLSIILSSVGAVPATILVPPPGLLLDCSDVNLAPLELSVNEGFIIRGTVPATGTWKFGVQVQYDEIDPARYF